MNKIFKGLGALALAGALSLQSTNVFAAEKCEVGEAEKTAYYIFLASNSPTYLKKEIKDAKDNNTTFGLFTSSMNAQVAAGSTIIEQRTGSVNIKDVAKNKQTDVDPTKASEEWSVAEFWYNTYGTGKNLNYVTDSEDGLVTYVYHNGYIRYSSADHTNGEIHVPDEDGELSTAVSNSLNEVLSKLVEGKSKEEAIKAIEQSDLVKHGTIIPETVYEVPGLTAATSQSSWISDRLFRGFDLTDFDTVYTGIALKGKNDTTSQVVYSPGAYKVVYCAKPDAKNNEKLLQFDANEGTDAPDNIIFITEANIPTDQDKPKRDGYEFVEWNTKKDGSGDKYQRGDKYTGDSATLYAQWKAIGNNDNNNNDDKKGPFTITYDANGGKNAPEAQKSDGTKCLTISDGKPTRSYGQFLGWSTDKDAVEADKRFAAGKEYCGEDGNITLYAIWSGKTGLSAHVVAFGGAILVAGIALYVAKKKDLLKQI